MSEPTTSLDQIKATVEKLEDAIRTIAAAQDIIDEALGQLGSDPVAGLTSFRNELAKLWNDSRGYAYTKCQGQEIAFPDADTKPEAARAQLIHELSSRVDHLKKILSPAAGGWNPSKTAFTVYHEQAYILPKTAHVKHTEKTFIQRGG